MSTMDGGQNRSGGNTGGGDAKATEIIDLKELAREATAERKAPGLEATLLVMGGPRQGETIVLNKTEMFIGRESTCDICILEESISRKHAKITVVGKDQVALMDPGSSNGTFVNGAQLQKGVPVVLTKEDVIKIGKNTFLKFLPAGSIESALLKDLGNKGLTDKLTGIANKGLLEQRLEPEFKRAKGMGQNLSLVFMDLDFFKKINDTYGHAAGDHVLVEYARLVGSRFVTGKHDVFARYGGEEFVLVLPGTSIEDALKKAEEIRAAVESHPFIFEGKKLPVTSSLGVARVNDATTTHEQLMKRADEALYKAKQTGRNRVVAAEG